jgi:hypothetical protein
MVWKKIPLHRAAQHPATFRPQTEEIDHPLVKKVSQWIREFSNLPRREGLAHFASSRAGGLFGFPIGW